MINQHKKKWQERRQYTQEQIQIAATVLDEIRAGADTMASVRTYPLSKGGFIAKHTLVHVYRTQIAAGTHPADPDLLARIRMKPIRSLSGVSTVTVLTEPHSCPGECIFCPDEKGLPKSYLREEPGAARAYQNNFDPYLQVSSRLASYRAIGHPTDKIELLILGGSWSAYEPVYREWFVKRCLEAMNGEPARDLAEAQAANERAESRNVGMVVETRPDTITPEEIAHMRYVGITKVQMGAQSLDDRILEINRRGHNAADTLQACALLRAAGFKIVLHWMPNLLGSTPESDREDFTRLWSQGYAPDELKIYPTQLVAEAPLYEVWKSGGFQPYSTETLIELISEIKTTIPIFTRVNRIVRDIPAGYIVAGSRRSSLRQDIHQYMDKHGMRCNCIRCREIRGKSVDADSLVMEDFSYSAAYTQEHFIYYRTKNDRLAGFLRLAIPAKTDDQHFLTQRNMLYSLAPSLKDAGLIREVHIYGQSVEIGSDVEGAAQHSGLGTALLAEADTICRQAGMKNITVISAIGTRLYYKKKGFARNGLYMTKNLV